jgi:hypothetical protein
LAQRIPLYVDDDDNLHELTTAGQQEIIDYTIWAWQQDRNLVLTVGGNLPDPVGNLNSMTSSRLAPGAAAVNDTKVGGAPTEEDTPDIATLTTTYDRINQTVIPAIEPAAASSSIGNPVYYNDSGEIQAMTNQDVYDTFIYPAIDKIRNGYAAGGYYYVSTAQTLNGSTQIGGVNYIFRDEYYTPGQITEDNIPFANPAASVTTVNETYWLQYKDHPSVSHKKLVRITPNGDLQRYNEGEGTAYGGQPGLEDWTIIAQSYMRKAIKDHAGYQIRYEIYESGQGPTSTNMGSGIVDTRLSGTSAEGYLTREDTTLDYYYSQEVPNGIPLAHKTYFLKLYTIGVS